VERKADDPGQQDRLEQDEQGCPHPDDDVRGQEPPYGARTFEQSWMERAHRLRYVVGSVRAAAGTLG
jgi:hypothetical protein